MLVNKRIFLYSACALLAFAALALGVWGAKQKAAAEEYFEAAGEYMDAVNSVYVRCANELADNVYDMQVSLSKLAVSTSQSQTVLALEDIVRSSSASVLIMSRLPRTHASTEALMTFLVRTGDYARTLSRRALAGEELPEADIEQLDALYSSCRTLADDLSAAVTGGALAFALPEAGEYYNDEPHADGFFTAGEEDHDNAETVPEYPTLIYDGPFSESTEKAAPLGLGNIEATESEAFITAERLTSAHLEPAGEAGGKIPVYLFSGNTADGASVTAAVTKTGGRLLWFMRDASEKSETDEGSGLPDDAEYAELVAAGTRWLETAGYGSMTPTYALFYNGAALISFVYEQEGVRVYNDLIKVWVERGSLNIVGADANNYLFSHRERHMPAPAISEDEARVLANPRLEVGSVNLALIPLSPMTEGLCYELHGYYNGDEYAVYINALTGREEQIFRIISSGDGRAAV